MNGPDKEEKPFLSYSSYQREQRGREESLQIHREEGERQPHAGGEQRRERKQAHDSRMEIDPGGIDSVMVRACSVGPVLGREGVVLAPWGGSRYKDRSFHCEIKASAWRSGNPEEGGVGVHLGV